MSLTPQHRALIAQHGDSVADVRGRWSVDFDEHGIAAFIASVERAARAAAFDDVVAGIDPPLSRMDRASTVWRRPIRSALMARGNAGRFEMSDGDIGQLRAAAEQALKAIDSLLDFAGTVGPSSSYWEEIWPEHEVAVDALRDAIRAPKS